MNITRLAVLLLLAVIALTLSIRVSERTASAGGTGACSPPAPVAIPDADPGGITIDCVISSSETVSGLTVFLQIDHTWVGDLVVSMSHVNTGTAVSLIDRPGVPVPTSIGCGGDNILATLDDAAPTPVENECANDPPPTINGTFRPNSPLSAFNSESLGGTWRLTVSDNEAIDTGQVVQWILGGFGGGTDSDQDGCSDAAESQTAPGSEVSGGRRNPQNFWDFYDVPAGPGLIRDGSVSAIDIFAVIGRFNTKGNPSIDPLSTPPVTGYHTAYDRGPLVGPNPDVWDLGPANGSIAGTDIFSILGQFNHSCA